MPASAILTVLANHCPRLAGGFDAKVADAINDAVDACIETADPLTRVDTGQLRGDKDIKYATAGSFEGEVTWNAEYAGFQNDGTIYISGTHFADNGAEAGGERLTAGMGGIFP